MAAVPLLGLDEWLLALYNGDAQLLWHQRWLLGTVVSTGLDHQVVKAQTGWDMCRTFLIASPDHDVYADECSVDNPELVSFRHCRVRLPPPPGIGARSMYRFSEDPTGTCRQEYMAAARVAADELFTAWSDAMVVAGRPAVPIPAGGAFRPLCNVTDLLARLGRAQLALAPAVAVAPSEVVVPLPPPVAYGPDGVVIPPPVLTGSSLADAAAVAAKWVVMESTTSATRGDTYLFSGTEIVRGRRGIGSVNGIDCAIFNLQGDDLEKFKGAEAGEDDRLHAGTSRTADGVDVSSTVNAVPCWTAVPMGWRHSPGSDAWAGAQDKLQLQCLADSGASDCRMVCRLHKPSQRRCNRSPSFLGEFESAVSGQAGSARS